VSGFAPRIVLAVARGFNSESNCVSLCGSESVQGASSVLMLFLLKLYN
jgi:hypothetical protein